MKLRTLGYTGINLSVIGLGTWAIGGGDYSFGWGPQDDRQSIKTIQRALELGINWIDTAPVYGSGHSEKIVGQAIKDFGENVFISTKCGIQVNENSQDLHFSLKKDDIQSEIDLSLSRLGIETIDLYQIHKPVPDEDIEAGWNTLADLVKAGKVRFAGVTSFNLEQLKRIQRIHPVSFLQCEYNLLERSIEDELLSYCSDNQIGVVCYSPMASGLLTGKFTHEMVKQFPSDDWRKTSDPHFQEPMLSDNLHLVENLRPLAEKNNKSLAQLAIAWVLRREEVTSAIVGARRPSQIEQTISGGEWAISEEDISEIDSIIEKHNLLAKEKNT